MAAMKTTAAVRSASHRAFLTLAVLALAGAVTVSNVQPRLDATGAILDVADGNLLQHDGLFYLYGVRYQPCPVSQQSNCYNPCGYYNNTFAVYVSSDLVKWELGASTVLPAMDVGPLNSSSTVYFSPFVVFNAATQLFVMWFQYAFKQRAVAAASSPLGPFTIVAMPNATGLPPRLVSGSSVYLWVDARDHQAYMLLNIILRGQETGNSMFVARLSLDYTRAVEVAPVDWDCLPAVRGSKRVRVRVCVGGLRAIVPQLKWSADGCCVQGHSDPVGNNSACFQEGGGIFNVGDDWFVLGGNGCCFCALGADTKVPVGGWACATPSRWVAVCRRYDAVGLVCA